MTENYRWRAGRAETSRTRTARRAERELEAKRKMKDRNQRWQNFIVAGALIGTFGGGQIPTGQFGRSLGSEILALTSGVVGLLADRQSRREKK